jgi:excinuclease UvrABC ATPase subunit
MRHHDDVLQPAPRPPLPTADPPGVGAIRITGAREHNLKDVSVEIPHHAITVFTGVSGSGKSSIVFDTVAAEAQRQLHATFPAFIRGMLPRLERPRADAVEGLTTPVVVDQRPVGGNARSTVATMTDIAPILRTLFSRFGAPTDGRASVYSFNDPAGMCPECEGIGRALRVDPERIVDRARSLDDGAILVPGHKPGSTDWQLYARNAALDPAKPLRDYDEEEWRILLHGSGPKIPLTFKNGTFSVTYEGLVDKLTRKFVKRDVSGLSEKTREAIRPFITDGICRACDGARLNEAALATRIDGRNIAEWSRMQISDLLGVVGEVRDPRAASVVEAARVALERVDAIGLGYLSLDRATSTLSGGEGQRLKLVGHLGNGLTGMTYVFDEPSTGLHPHDVGRLTDLLRALRDKGNTVLVVEHDADVIAIADRVVDVGPGAGVHGGEIVFEGSVDELRAADTLTGRNLGRPAPVKDDVRAPTGALGVEHASLHNLRDVSVEIPTGVLVAITGVAGSGKSTLITQVLLDDHPDAILVDQGPITASSRSTPASYLGLMDTIRKLFAKASGASPGLFSFNSTGACGECEGRGVIITEVAYMDPVTTHCEACDGRRFKEDVLAHRLRGLSIADVLDLPAESAAEFFTEPALRRRAQGIVDVGLGYLTLGQPLSSLSGGERQRIKLADQLDRTGTVYVLDEPTTGLHMADVDTLLGLMDALVDDGNTVIVIEHDLRVIAHADWIVDLGPGGGNEGGSVVFEGTPAELIAARGDSLTGEHLRRAQTP